MVKSYKPGGIGMIEALPGTYLVHAYFDDSQVELVKSNVIGWQIGSERVATPLVVDPRAASEPIWNVIHPDGRVECNDGQCWENVDRWISEQKKRRREAA